MQLALYEILKSFKIKVILFYGLVFIFLFIVDWNYFSSQCFALNL